jgi:hypothetical protein
MIMLKLNFKKYIYYFNIKFFKNILQRSKQSLTTLSTLSFFQRVAGLTHENKNLLQCMHSPSPRFLSKNAGSETDTPIQYSHTTQFLTFSSYSPFFATTTVPLLESCFQSQSKIWVFSVQSKGCPYHKLVLENMEAWL